MKLQRQHFSPQLFKDPECWSSWSHRTHDLPRHSPVHSQMSHRCVVNEWCEGLASTQNIRGCGCQSGRWGHRKWVLVRLGMRQHWVIVILQVNARSGPVHHTRSRSILAKRHITMEPRLPRNLASSFENQKFVLCHIFPPAL